MSGTPTMTCEIFADRLMDLLEGDLDGATCAAMEAHARACPGCGALLANLRRIPAEAAGLPAFAPSRDLWAGIAARIDAPVVRLDARRPVWKSPRVRGVAMAAAVVLTAALGYRLAGRRSAVPAPAAPVAARPALPSDTPAAVEQSYDREIAGLRAVLDTRRSHLDSATVAVIERNLVVIDSAIAQCKQALAKDPASRYLMQSLSQSLDTKVQLLRIAAALPSST